MVGVGVGNNDPCYLVDRQVKGLQPLGYGAQASAEPRIDQQHLAILDQDGYPGADGPDLEHSVGNAYRLAKYHESALLPLSASGPIIARRYYTSVSQTYVFCNQVITKGLDHQRGVLRPGFSAVDGGLGAPLCGQAADSLIDLRIEAQKIAGYAPVQHSAVGIGVGE